jgi:hypothetical protein
MVNTSGAEALFRCINIFVKEPCPASSDRFTGVQAKRHREIVQVNAMKGNRWPVTVLSTSIKMLHDHTLLRRDGTKRVAEWGTCQVRVYRLSTDCSLPERDGQWAKPVQVRISWLRPLHKPSQLERDGCGGRKGWQGRTWMSWKAQVVKSMCNGDQGRLACLAFHNLCERRRDGTDGCGRDRISRVREYSC